MQEVLRHIDKCQYEALHNTTAFLWIYLLFSLPSLLRSLCIRYFHNEGNSSRAKTKWTQKDRKGRPRVRKHRKKPVSIFLSFVGKIEPRSAVKSYALSTEALQIHRSPLTSLSPQGRHARFRNEVWHDWCVLGNVRSYSSLRGLDWTGLVVGVGVDRVENAVDEWVQQRFPSSQPPRHKATSNSYPFPSPLCSPFPLVHDWPSKYDDENYCLKSEPFFLCVWILDDTLFSLWPGP